ncbi:hypothetical protein SZN_03462 [Streptomyces zinciresistens K42]|uniref:Uncharacterized protein n=1 Tax=Streptomyces zinciresistens K42 TaxID=700597 RepID=G2G5D9_9ACTN|nr:hypothetical protein [Streptomyces zinciresistens]EGX61319.1 hypothetical protein SZN_03462 [Streptomyces zinciresistens K42]
MTTCQMMDEPRLRQAVATGRAVPAEQGLVATGARHRGAYIHQARLRRFTDGRATSSDRSVLDGSASETRCRRVPALQRADGYGYITREEEDAHCSADGGNPARRPL